jgi:HSP20 family protein
MADLIRWDPYRDLLTMRELMDRVFDRSLPNVTSGAWDMNLALDVIENSDEFVVKASIPGINPDDLEITYNDRTLTVKGELKEDKEISEEHYHLRERRFGTFSRSINLPTNIDADHIAANYEAGVLELHLPKTEEAKPRRIQVKGSDKVLAG